MGYLLDVMTPEKVDGQRSVVMNERRQSYENRPYGMAFWLLFQNLFPSDFPYHWLPIGSMEDLKAASYNDVVSFFKKYYGPNNACLVVAGDIDPDETLAKVKKWFGSIPASEPVPPQAPPAAVIRQDKRIIYEDNVQLPRLYMAWISPAYYEPGDAASDVLATILAGGKNSRLYKKLVYDLQVAQDVSAFQMSQKLASGFIITATAKSGHNLNELFSLIQVEIDSLKSNPPQEHELQRAVNQYEASFLRKLEKTGGFGGKADLLNAYYYYTGNPDYFNEDLARYKALEVNDIQAIARRVLKDNERVVLSIVPTGKTDLAVAQEKED